MAAQKYNEDEKSISDDYLSSTIEIILDDQSATNSGDEMSMSQIRKSRAETTAHETVQLRKKKPMSLRDPKSHRLIEKRRRDRMNACLTELLKLTPHKSTDNQRRIEKTEIIEMAINHIRHLKSLFDQKVKTSDATLDAYQTGYINSLSDVVDFLNEHAQCDQYCMDLIAHLKDKDVELQNLTAMPDKKRPKYSSLSDKRIQSSKEQLRKNNSSDTQDNKHCTIPESDDSKHHNIQSSTTEQQTPTEQCDSVSKVPIFVLHPSGTHYIPMCIDASIVSHAFTRNSTMSNSSSSKTQTNCHPVSIPVNFNPITALSDPYELDIQNINVIGTRHQTSVRPN